MLLTSSQKFERNYGKWTNNQVIKGKGVTLVLSWGTQSIWEEIQNEYYIKLTKQQKRRAFKTLILRNQPKGLQSFENLNILTLLQFTNCSFLKSIENALFASHSNITQQPNDNIFKFDPNKASRYHFGVKECFWAGIISIIIISKNHLKSYKIQSEFWKIAPSLSGECPISDIIFIRIDLGISLCPDSNLRHYGFSSNTVSVWSRKEAKEAKTMKVEGQFIKGKRFEVFIRRKRFCIQFPINYNQEGIKNNNSKFINRHKVQQKFVSDAHQPIKLTKINMDQPLMLKSFIIKDINFSKNNKSQQLVQQSEIQSKESKS